MSKQIICPYCFQRFVNTEAMCQCINNEVKMVDGLKVPCCAKEEDKALSNNRHTNGLVSKHIFKTQKSLLSSQPKPTKCDRCGVESNRFVCPHCHNWLPNEMIYEGAEIISIIGAPSSGKTVYFTALIKTLQNYGFKLGLSVRAKDEAQNPNERTSVIYSGLKGMLFDDGYLPPQTPKCDYVIPLIFRLTSSVEAGKYNKNDRHIYLVFYDTAGESFTDIESLTSNVKYLKESSGIILLLDPFSVKSLNNMFKQAGIVSGESRGDIAEVLTQLLGSVDNDKSLRNKPVAVTFSKIDAVVNGLEQIGESAIPGIDLLRDSSFIRTNKFSIHEIDQISEALKKYCVDKWGIGQIMQDVGTAFMNYKLFGISSLGAAPNDSLRVSDVKPYRVLDPLVWILTQMKGFHIPQENH